MAKQPTEKTPETPIVETIEKVLNVQNIDAKAPQLLSATLSSTKGGEPAPDSPWTLVHSDDTADTYLLELKSAGVVLRTETNSGSSSVFLANVNKGQLGLKA